MGQEEYTFAANEEANCDLLRLQNDRQGSAAEEVAQIRQKLNIQVCKLFTCRVLICKYTVTGHPGLCDPSTEC